MSDESNRARKLTRRSLVMGSGGALLGGCEQPDDAVQQGATWELSYRIIIRATSGGRRREGASVFRTIYRRTSSASLVQTGHFQTETWGEAIPMDLGAGRQVFGLLGDVSGVRSEGRLIVNHPRSVISILPRSESTGEAFTSGAVYERVAGLSGAHPWPRSGWPVLTNFTNRSQAETAALVPWPGEDYEASPNTAVRSVAAVFGRDVTLDGVWVEIANAGPTDQIERLLPWVARMPGADGGYHVTGGDERPFGERLRFDNLKMSGYRG